MLRKLFALIALALLPTGAVFALPAGPIPQTAFTVQSALLDSAIKTGLPKDNTAQQILGYTMAFHDDTYQYSLPVCKDAILVEVDNTVIDPATFQVNDSLVVTARPNAILASKSCISRVVRQAISRGTSAGECLQNYQVQHSIDGSPSPMNVRTEYNFNIIAYTRPTLSCDSKAYGTAPITTVVAKNQPFIVTVSRPNSSGSLELMRWSLTTDSAGQASFSYTFNLPNDKYQFQVFPASGATAGDTIGWTTKVVDPSPASPSPVAAAASGPYRLTTAPIVVVLVIVLLVAAGFEYRHFFLKNREAESPEDEYNRTSQL